MSDQTREQLNLLDFLAFLIRWRKLLITLTVLVGIIVGVISFLLPPKYRSTGVVRFQGETGTSFGSLVTSKLASLGGIGGFAPTLGEISGQFFLDILNSVELGERVVNEFDLRKVYHMEKAPIEDVVKSLQGKTRWDFNAASSTITLYVEDRSPERAKQMTDYFIAALDTRWQQLKSERAHHEREFLSGRLDQAKSDLAALEDSLYRYELRTGVLNAEEQVKASIQAGADLEAKRLALQTELEMAKRVFGESSPEIGYLRLRLASMDSSLQQIVRPTDEQGGTDFLIRLKDAPIAVLVQARLMRDIEIQQLLVGYLLQQFEQAKVDEARNVPTIQVIDPPIVPAYKSWPRRGLLVGVGILLALAIGIIYGLLSDLFSSAARNPDHPQHAHLMKLKQSWSEP